MDMPRNMMCIESIEVKNFKSLVDFKLDLDRFTCLIGLNGSGKSTVLQFIDFLGHLVGRGPEGIESWLEDRNWKSEDIRSTLANEKNVTFSVSLVSHENQECITWQGEFDTEQLYCVSELIKTTAATIEVNNGQFRVTLQNESKPVIKDIIFDYKGSILSGLARSILIAWNKSDVPYSPQSLKDFFLSISSPDLLSPELLRQPSIESEDSIGFGGESLSSFLHAIGAEKRDQLRAKLAEVYRQLIRLDTKRLSSNLRLMEIEESFDRKNVVTDARHINDGMLRLIAIFAELQTEHQFILFDEIENGINPELVEFLVDSFVQDSDHQTLVTTHSPLILNYLEDDIAKKSVMYLYKTPQGHTKSIPFFSIPTMAEKLKFMGPGVVYADTNLTELFDEIAEVTGEEV
jgi:AAA15 family ATPase/GTPase